MKVAFDLVVREQYAFPILYAASAAKRYGYDCVILVELGVASGSGLLNMCRIAERTTRATGIHFRVIGFDGGKGMPPAIDYRDLPEHFQIGELPDVRFCGPQAGVAIECGAYHRRCRGNRARLARKLTKDMPLGFVAVDVDYYSAAKAAMAILEGAPENYLPLVPVYLDDIGVDGSNPWNGELLAISEFNAENALRKIAPFTLLRSRRIFKHTQWIDRMYAAHIHDHPYRSPKHKRATKRVIANEYLR